MNWSRPFQIIISFGAKREDISMKPIRKAEGQFHASSTANYRKPETVVRMMMQATTVHMHVYWKSRPEKFLNFFKLQVPPLIYKINGHNKGGVRN